MGHCVVAQNMSEEVVQDAPLENNELNAEIDLQKTIQEGMIKGNSSLIYIIMP